MIENGRISPLVPDASTDAWGATSGNRSYVWRSAVGVRGDGSVVFVIGSAMDIRSLADVMHAAGAVTAMELDINPSWTSFITYARPAAGQVVPAKLTAAEQASAYRYLQPSSRDFVAVLCPLVRHIVARSCRSCAAAATARRPRQREPAPARIADEPAAARGSRFAAVGREGAWSGRPLCRDPGWGEIR